MANITKAFTKRLDGMKPNEALIVRVNTTDLDKAEFDIRVFTLGITLQLTDDREGYQTMLTKSQIIHFIEGDYPYITSIVDCPNMSDVRYDRQ